MYDNYDSDNYFFSNEITFLLEQKNKEEIIRKIKQKHAQELQENFFPLSNKRNDLLIWNVIFIREIIKNGSSKQFIHTLYNKFYETIQNLSCLEDMQKIELDMANAYLEILINSIEITNNFVTNKIIALLYIHIEDHLNLNHMANELNISTTYMSNCFKKNMGISIMKYYKNIKISRAKTLLKNTDKSILEISTTLSFCDQCNFSKIFKELVNLTPMQYRNTCRKSNGHISK